MSRRRAHSSDDEEYVPRSTKSNRERQRKYRESDKGKAAQAKRQQEYRDSHPDQLDPSHATRQQEYRDSHPGQVDSTHAVRQKQYLHSLQDEYNISEENLIEEPSYIETKSPVLHSHHLGKRNNLCKFCWALHFPGVHSCCQNGQIFIPPFEKMPEPLNSFFFDINDKRRKKFLDKILEYNTLFSFASIQYSHVRAAKFGIQVAKARGAVRHFTSTVEPNDPCSPKYGNFYVYDGKKAAEERLNHPFLTNLDEEIVKQLSICMESHPFARFYKRMGQILEEERKQNRNELTMRMRIVDPFEYQQLLQAHPKVYATEHSDDYVSVFYSAKVDHSELPHGLILYPKLGTSVPRPLFPWKKETNTLCYSLMFPRGEPGYYPKGYLRYTPKPFEQRLRKYMEECYANSKSTNFDYEEEAEKILIMQHATKESDPNLEEETDSDDEIDDYDTEYNQTMRSMDESKPQTVLTKIESGGEIFPLRVSGPAKIHTLSYESDSGDENDDSFERSMETGDIVSQHQQNTDHLIFGRDETETNEHESNLLNDAHETDSLVHEYEDINLEEMDDFSQRRKKRKYASMREYALYIHQKRKNFRNRISSARKLGQVFTIDMFTRIQHSRLEMIEKHNTEYMTSTKKKLLDAFQRTANRYKRRVGCVTSVPSTVPGSPRYLQKKFEEAVAMTNQLGRPDLFITFTANGNWPEIKDNIPESETWADHPFLLNEVFKKKCDEMLIDVVGKPHKKGSRLRRKGIFGFVRWFTYSIEFQQRGPPHMHLIVSLVNHLRTVQQVDAVCQAEIPVLPNCEKESEEYIATEKLRALVERFMVHSPCENNSEAYCNVGRKPHWKTCNKHFPKPFNDTTQIGDKDYPALRRRDNGECFIKTREGEKIRATNQHIVAFNSYLLSKYACHINVEAISSIKVLKYIFKYLFKGLDRVLIETTECIGLDGGGSYGVTGEMTMNGHIMYPKALKIPPGVIKKRIQDVKEMLRKNHIHPKDEHGNDVVVFNECHMLENLRATTAPEAAWEMAGNPRNGASHTVVTNFVHTPDEEPIRMDIDKEEEAYQEVLEHDVTSRLKAWFDLNASNDSHSDKARECTFDELPKYFTYANGKWVWRKKDYTFHTLGRIKFVRPRYMEQFAVRLLCMHKKGVKSFEDLRTVNGTVHETFVKAAQAMRLMNSAQEWDDTLSEAAQYQSPVALRRLFVSILLNCAPANPLELWEKHKKEFYVKSNWSDAENDASALYQIQSGLMAHGMGLGDFNLPDYDITAIPDELINDAESQPITPGESKHVADSIYEKMTDEQKRIVKRIEDSVMDSENHPQSFFIEGMGGCGKTFVYQYLYHLLQARGIKHYFHVICVAHTGVAANLLPNGTTAHRAFSIPLTTEENMKCRIELESEKAMELSSVEVVLFDEASMTDRRIYNAIDTLFKYLHSPQKENVLFGGVTFVFGGDFRQTLPIVDGTDGAGVIDYTMIRSELWQKLEILHLTKNIRAQEDPSYSNWIKKIGEGRNYIEKNCEDVHIPDDYLVENESALIENIYGARKIEDKEYVKSACILTVSNATSLELNKKILKLLPEKEIVKLSVDEYDEDRGFSDMQPEVYNMITPSGMPPYRLSLKVGSIVILLKNINVFLGLCNGLRMEVLMIGQDLIICKPLIKTKNTPDKIFLHRMAMYPTKATSREMSFIRWQYPIRNAYAMTINKSQGQTFNEVGLLLRSAVFAHGQLYVALSRVRSRNSIHICNESHSDKNKTRNVVYKEVIP